MPEIVPFSADLQSIAHCHVPHSDEDAILQQVLRESLQEHKEVKSIRDQNLRPIRPPDVPGGTSSDNMPHEALRES